ncbi:MAG TPA: hypothetical protein PKH54_00765, partial [Myxococcota bacterium]|nr:hypothetical protein [Myxococcota bacterium]
MKGNSLFLMVAVTAATVAFMSGAGCGGDATPGQDVLQDSVDPGDIPGDDVDPADVPPTDVGTDTMPDTPPDAADIGLDEIGPDIDQDVPFQYPDAKLINENRNSPVSVPDEPYLQKMT